MSIEDYINEDDFDRDGMDADSFLLGKYEVLGETQKAIRVRRVGLRHTFWVPKSQLREPNECCGIGDRGELYISNWWATKLEEEEEEC